MAAERLLSESLAGTGSGTVECGTCAGVFATLEALSLPQSSSTHPSTALVSGLGPETLPGNACFRGLPLITSLSSRLWGTSPLDRARGVRVALAVYRGGTHHGHRSFSLVADRGRSLSGALLAASAPRVGRGSDRGRAGQFGQSSQRRGVLATGHASALSAPLQSRAQSRRASLSAPTQETLQCRLHDTRRVAKRLDRRASAVLGG